MGTIAEMSMYTAAFGALIGTMTVAIGEIGMSLERAKTEIPIHIVGQAKRSRGGNARKKETKRMGKPF